MGQAPDLKRVTIEDFDKDDQKLVGKLAFIINSFHEQVRSVLAKNVDFDNLAQEVKTLSFTTGSNGQPLNTVSFKSGVANKIQGISTVRLVITSNNTSFPTQLPVISWSQSASLVTITNIGGLQAETRYDLTILTI
jgi:tetrahydromethanopterin S-methyltransferase subunit D